MHKIDEQSDGPKSRINRHLIENFSAATSVIAGVIWPKLHTVTIAMCKHSTDIVDRDNAWHVVYPFCPHGGDIVVLVKQIDAGQLIAFCMHCGAAWHQPQHITEENDEYVICSHVAPNGIELPTPNDVAASPWADRVLDIVPYDRYFSIGEINQYLDRERTQLAAKEKKAI